MKPKKNKTTQVPKETDLIVRYKTPRLKCLYSSIKLDVRKVAKRDIFRLAFEKNIRFFCNIYEIPEIKKNEIFCDNSDIISFEYLLIEIRAHLRYENIKYSYKNIWNIIDNFFVKEMGI